MIDFVLTMKQPFVTFNSDKCQTNLGKSWEPFRKELDHRKDAGEENVSDNSDDEEYQIKPVKTYN